MNLISQISPVTDAEAARLVRCETMAALADDIARSGTLPLASTPARTAGRTAARTATRTAWPDPRRPTAQRPRLRKRLLIGVPVAATLAVAGLIVTSLGAPGQHLGPVAVGPPKAQAAVLSFTRQGGFIKVIVRNPLADPKRYRAEFAKYHLDISLSLVPASPSIVGTLVAESLSSGSAANQLKPITATGRCSTGGGGNVCPVGVRVPVDFHGSATLVFGRAARPGEQYESSAQADSPGEVMHGLHYEGKTVAAVLAMLAKRGVSVPQWRVQRGGQCYTDVRRTVPGNWLVYQAVPWAPGQVLLWAAKTLPVGDCTPVPGSPAPTPTRAGSGG
jgi:hypothetical protein